MLACNQAGLHVYTAFVYIYLLLHKETCLVVYTNLTISNQQLKNVRVKIYEYIDIYIYL